MKKTPTPLQTIGPSAQASRFRAGWIALAVGICVLIGKFAAYSITGSTAVLSDALESVINVAAAAMLLVSLMVAARPADSSHPYGHGKVEFLSAGVEGALIVVAGVLIAVESIRALTFGPELRSLDSGLVLLAGMSLLNAGLGTHLVRVGRRTHSAALVADGKHVLTDVWTSVGVLVGLGAVRLTGWQLLDPLIALAVGLNILRQGWQLVHDALRGLMDAADPVLLERLTRSLEVDRDDRSIRVHGLRAWLSGAFCHLDLHLVVPRYLDAEELHGVHDAMESRLLKAAGIPGEVVVHFDPCRGHMCPHCTVSECPVRESAFQGREALTVAEVIRTDEAAEFWNSRHETNVEP